MKLIQIYGSMNSGTTYLYKLLWENFNVVVSKVRKHDGPTNGGENYKNNHDDFLKVIKQDNLNVTPKDYIDNDGVHYVIITRDPRTQKNGINLWNSDNRRYYNFYLENKDNCVLVKYEDLLGDVSRVMVLDKIKNKFTIPKKSGDYVDITKHSHHLYSEDKDKKFNKSDGLIKKYNINGVDEDLLNRLGYGR